MLIERSNPASADLNRPRLVTFAAQHPDLAKLVHRLQLQVPPITCGGGLWNQGEWSDPARPLARHLNLDNEEPDSKEKFSAIYDILISPLEKWRDAQWYALSYEDIDNGRSPCPASISVRDTFRSLPNLYHVEHSLSIRDRLTFGALESNVLEKTGVCIDRESLMWILTPGSFEAGFDLMIPHLGTSITSLKLRRTELSQATAIGEQLLPAALRHLDLEVSGRYDYEVHGEPLTRVWRRHLTALQRLTTLRLRWAEPQRESPDPFYIDELLIDPKRKAIFFPHLKCLSVSSCLLRRWGLVAFATLHASTLEELELSHVTFDPSYCPESWSEIGALCKSVLPNLAHLRLSKLVTHFPEPSKPIAAFRFFQEIWNPGLEATTAYEWRKGRYGPDQEVKGSRCPWEPKDIIVPDECKEDFNGDRFSYYARDLR